MEKVKIAICGACLVIVAILGYCYISEKQNEKYEYIVNSAISNIVDTVIEKYPDVREEEILNILRNTKNNKTNILKKYGYLDNENYIKKLEDEKNVDRKINILYISIFGIVIILIVIYYNNKKEIRIREVNQYLNEVNRGNYKLKIEENGEDEISRLRNELYKTTILLRETAENSEKEKVSLSNSLADISHQIKTPITSMRIMLDNIEDNPNMDMVPRTFIFGAKAAAGYQIAKKTIKLINSVADVINNDKSINGKLKVVFIEDYRVSNAELIFAAADVSEQISTASKEASGTGNMKFMLNGALTVGTMDGANVEIVEEVGAENVFIFGTSSDDIIRMEHDHSYDPMQIFNNDQDIRRVLMQLINGYYSPQDPELFRDIYNSLLNTKNSAKADTYFILKDFRSYAEAQKRVEAAYRDEKGWARMAMLNVAHAGKFTSDRTIQEYVDDIWKLDKVTVELPEEAK